MFYLILIVQVVLVGVVGVFAARWYRATPEKRAGMFRPTKRDLFLLLGAVLAGILASVSFMFAFGGMAAIRTTSAAKDYLKALHGPTSTWTISLSEHVEKSATPKAGSYLVRYRYGEKSGYLLAEYDERDGEFTISFKPRDEIKNSHQ